MCGPPLWNALMTHQEFTRMAVCLTAWLSLLASWLSDCWSGWELIWRTGCWSGWVCQGSLNESEHDSVAPRPLVCVCLNREEAPWNTAGNGIHPHGSDMLSNVVLEADVLAPISLQTHTFGCFIILCLFYITRNNKNKVFKQLCAIDHGLPLVEALGTQMVRGTCGYERSRQNRSKCNSNNEGQPAYYLGPSNNLKPLTITLYSWYCAFNCIGL